MAYSITTQDGITINNIPDDIAPDAPELKARVAAIRAGQTEKPAQPTAQPQEGPSTGQQLARQVGLTARAVPGALASTLGIVGDPLNALVNMIIGGVNKVTAQPTLSSLITGEPTGLNIPKLQTISGATESLLTRAGLPEPQSTAEKIVYDINRAALGAAGPGAAIRAVTPQAPVRVAPQARTEPTFVPPVSPVSPAGVAQQALVENLGLQTTGAVGGTLAAQLAAQAGGGPVAQFAAGLTGGVLAPGAAQTISGRTVAGGREAVRPFTEAGREVIAGNVLRQLSASPEVAAARAAAYEPRIPGYQPTTAQATRDVGLVSAEPTIRAMDTTGRFVAQQSAANQARMTILDRMAKDKTDIDAAIAKRDEVTDPLREQAFSRSTVSPETFQSSIVLTVNKTIDDILNSPMGKRGTVISVMDDAKADISRATSPQELYEIRKDLRAAQLGQLDKSGRGGPSAGAYKVAGTQLNQVIKAVDDAIEAAAPGYKNYLDKYSKASKGIESLEAAQAFRNKVLLTTPDPITGQYLISQPAFTRAIREIEKGGFEGLSTTQIGTLKRVSKDLDDGVLTRAGKMPGSDTFKNMSTANVIGGIIGKQIFGETSPFLQKVTAPLNWLYNGTDDRIRELLVDAMLDPKLASKLMGKATTNNIETIGQELQRRAINLGYGSIFGLTE